MSHYRVSVQIAVESYDDLELPTQEERRLFVRETARPLVATRRLIDAVSMDKSPSVTELAVILDGALRAVTDLS